MLSKSLFSIQIYAWLKSRQHISTHVLTPMQYFDGTLMMSVPRRTPPSIQMGILPFTAEAIDGSTSRGAGAKSSCRPPWLETMMASTPASAALIASSGSRIPCKHHQKSRSKEIWMEKGCLHYARFASVRIWNTGLGTLQVSKLLAAKGSHAEMQCRWGYKDHLWQQTANEQLTPGSTSNLESVMNEDWHHLFTSWMLFKSEFSGSTLRLGWSCKQCKSTFMKLLYVTISVMASTTPIAVGFAMSGLASEEKSQLAQLERALVITVSEATLISEHYLIVNGARWNMLASVK